MSYCDGFVALLLYLSLAAGQVGPLKSPQGLVYRIGVIVDKNAQNVRDNVTLRTVITAANEVTSREVNVDLQVITHEFRDYRTNKNFAMYF